MKPLAAGLDFIDSHLHEPVDLRSVSQAATMSPRSFQRTFKAVTGDTVRPVPQKEGPGEQRDRFSLSAG
jgi:transcriptional regulator GlxA family with amidase domain